MRQGRGATPQWGSVSQRPKLDHLRCGCVWQCLPAALDRCLPYRPLTAAVCLLAAAICGLLDAALLVLSCRCLLSWCRLMQPCRHS